MTRKLDEFQSEYTTECGWLMDHAKARINLVTCDNPFQHSKLSSPKP